MLFVVLAASILGTAAVMTYIITAHLVGKHGRVWKINTNWNTTSLLLPPLA
jgi:hypothetical protein